MTSPRIAHRLSFGRLKSGQGAFLGFLKKTNPALAAQFKLVGGTEDAFLLLSDAIDKTADPAKRAALVKAAGLPQEFLRFFADGPDALRKNIAEVKVLLGWLGPKAYDAADDFNDSMGDVGMALKGLSARMAVSVLPMLTPMLQDLASFIAANRDAIAKGFKEIAADVGAALRAFGQWAGALKVDDFRAFWAALKEGGTIVAQVAGSVRDLVLAIKDLGGWKAIIGTLIAVKAGGGFSGLFGNLLGGLFNGPGGGKPGGSSSLLPWLLGTLAAPLAQLALYQLGKTGIQKGMEALPHPTYPKGFDPKTFDPWTDLETQIFGDGMAEDRATRARAGDYTQPKADDLRAEALANRRFATQMDAELRRWQASGDDKTRPEEFAKFLSQRAKMNQALAYVEKRLARVMQQDAQSIGKKIGEEAGDSLYQRMMMLLGAGAGAAGGQGSGGGVVNAAWRPMKQAQSATQAAFSGNGGGMLDLIAAAEEGTGRNYNATFGNGLLTGGPMPLAGMSLDQIDALQTRMLKHPGNAWNTSALGRYQFVRTRLRDLRQRYGIPGSALFSPQLQDRLAKLSLAERGGSVRGLRNEWQGLNRVPATVLRDAMRRQRHREDSRPAGRIEGSASVDIRFPNGMPAGTKVGAAGKGLFREVNLDTGRSMKPALA